MKPYYLIKGLVEIPRSTFIIATGGFELKLYSSASYRAIIKLCKIFNIPFIFVMHSWDMIDVKDSLTTRLCSSKEFERKLLAFLKYSSRKVKYVKMEEIYEKIKNS